MYRSCKSHESCVSISSDSTWGESLFFFLRAVVKQFGTTNSLFALEPFENEKRHYHLSQGFFFFFLFVIYVIFSG